jgi:predicted transcriptional regulator
MAEEMLQHLGEQGLANCLGVPRSLIGRYLCGEHKPQFEFCVQIVAEHESMAVRLAQPSTQPDTPLREFETEFSASVDMEAIRAHLKRILSGDLPPIMREEIAEVFGVSSVFLGIHFPEECNQITVMRRMATISRGGTEAMKGHLRRAIQQVKREGHQLKWESVLASMPTDVLKSARTRDIMKAYYDISRKVSGG